MERGSNHLNRARIASGIVRQPLKLGLASCVAEYHFMFSPRQDRPKYSAHQSGTWNANSHGAS
jgi:hypothetical protein